MAQRDERNRNPFAFVGSPTPALRCPTMRNQLVRQAIAPLRSIYASSITAPATVEAMASLGLDGMQGYSR